ncbi:3-methyladenine DNA glycosylase AlkD [Rhodovulum bhavnagarense]|uniref:3-methyladenine DNA glycosylase AlkD n=1 Tax=Rhodovulum bhavnagarense TaxID=992286 RepID=A0A4R2RIW2_9RHOB|nr:DNA alkylation repair protein [Rhodovulum bhavnagarense]TCP62429.1 3-methyladenine DNA glycosylase AlkD [Rhodovulum bhavnagarense]
MTPQAAIEVLLALGDVQKNTSRAKQHKSTRVTLGIAKSVLDDLARTWRQGCDLDERLALARALWESDLHESRIVAAKLLTQARIRPRDEGAWRLIVEWMPSVDDRAIADALAAAGQKRLVADPARLDEVEAWTCASHVWTRRAALAMTLPWARMVHPKPADLAIRARVTGWAAGYAADPDRAIQQAISSWLRDLWRRDPDAVWNFITAHGPEMSSTTRKEVTRLFD